MKSLLLSFLVGLAVASNAVYEQAYRSRQEYVYKYESQISTGLIHASRQQAGFKMSTTARLQFVTQTAVRVRFEHTVLLKIDQPVVQIDPQVHTLPNDFLREWWAPEVANIINYLETPFGFKYSNGHVLQIALTKDEPEWSANAKRGFMALFEMNLEKRMMLDQHVTPKSSPNTLDMYTVFEQCPTGDCATMYTVHPVAEKGEVQTGAMHVEKVRDYDRCLEAPIYFKSPFQGQNHADQVNANPLSRQASIDYAIRGSNDQFIIMSAMAQERIVFSPSYNPESAEEIRTSVNQTLVLMSATTLSTEIPEVQADSQRQFISMSMPTNTSSPQDLFQPTPELAATETTNPYTAYTAERIVTHLKMAAQNTEYLTSKESLVHMRVVTEMMRTSCVHELRKVFNILAKQDTTPELMRFAAEIFFNTLPVVGTEAAANVILDICAEDLIMASNCSNVLTVLAVNYNPTPIAMMKLVNWIKKDKTGTLEVLRTKQYLTLGSFAFKLGTMRHQQWQQVKIANSILQRLMTDNRKYIRTMVQQKKQYLDEKTKNMELIFNEMGHTIVEMFEPLLASANVADKNLALKSLGNAGLPQSVPVLRRFLMNTQCDYHKVMAIKALWRIIDPVAANEAKELLMTVFMSKQENEAIRNTAFVVLTSMGLDLPLMEKIVNMMHSEKDAHVSNLVMSFLQTVANSTYQPMQRMSYMAATAIKSAPFYNVDMQHSFFRFWGQYSQEHRMGGAMAVGTTGQMDKFMGAYMRFDTTLYGVWSRALKFAFHSESFAEVFSKIAGPKGLGKSIFKALMEKPKDVSPQDFIQRIVQELNIKPRTFALPSGDFSVSVMGNEISYWDFTSIIKSLISGDKLPISFNNNEIRADLPIDYKHMQYLMDVKMQLPTEAGFPVGLQAQMSFALKVQGDMSVVMPLDRSSVDAPDHISIRPDIKPKAVVGMYATMGLDHHFLKPSVGFYGLIKFDAPIKKDIALDVTSNTFKLQVNHFLEDVLKTKPVIETIVEPVTEFVMMNPVNTGSPVMTVNVEPIYTSTGVRTWPIAHRVPMNILGWQFEITGQTPVQSWFPIPANPFRGRTTCNIWFTPMENAPTEIKYTATLNYNTQPMSAKFDKFGREQPVKQQLPHIVRQVVEKVHQHSDRPTPVSSLTTAHTTFSFDLLANAHTTERNLKMAIFAGPTTTTTATNTFMRAMVWRSPLPQDNQPFVFDGAFNVFYPTRAYEPEEIFNTEWQKELTKTLNYHTKFAPAKQVVNEFLNMTINSMLQNLNFLAMRKVPAFRVLDGIIPEHLIRVMKPELITETSRNWQTWFSKIQPLFEMVQEERKLLVDPHFTNKDEAILGYLQQLQEIQQGLIEEMHTIVQARTMMHRELPIMQWVVMRQADIVAALRDIVVRYEAAGTITRIAAIKEHLAQCFDLTETMSEKAMTIMTNVHFTRVGEADLSRDSPLKTLHEQLTALGLMQVKEITTMQTLIHKNQDLNIAQLMQLATFTQQTVTNLDNLIYQHNKQLFSSHYTTTRPPFFDNSIVEDIMLVTIQNEFLIHLVQSHYAVQSTRVAAPATTQREQEMICDELLKTISHELGERISQLFKLRAEQFSTTEKAFAQKMGAVKIIMLVSERRFIMDLVNNRNAQQDPAVAKVAVTTFMTALDKAYTQLREIVEGMTQLTTPPSLVLTADWMWATTWLKISAETGRQAMMSLLYPQRLQWIQQFDALITSTQSLIATMSPIWEEYNTASATPVLPTMPVALDNKYIVGVQDVIQHQRQIIKHLSKYIQDPTVKDDVLQQVLTTVLSKSEDFQTTLQQALKVHQQQLQQYQLRDNEIPVTAQIFTQATQQQQSIYSIVNSVLKGRPSKLHNVPELTRKLQSLQGQLSIQPYQTETPFGLPEGIYGVVNATWGTTGNFKNFMTTVFATRSVEQIYWLYSQLNAVVRSQELVQAVNKQMSHQTWDAANVKDMLNTYNHVHWIAKYTPNDLPMWFTQCITSLQETLKHTWWQHYTRQLSPAPVMSGQYQNTPTTAHYTQTIMEVSSFNHKMDMTVIAGHETDVFADIPMNPMWQMFKPTINQRSMTTPRYSYTFAGYTPVCMVHQDKVSTFDTVSYQLPYTKDYCKQLLAMDCSSDNSFAVTAKPSSIVSGAHILEVAGADKVITVTPVHLDLQVTVDQQPLILEDHQPVVFPGVVIVKRGLNVEVKLPETGLKVTVDGQLISLAISMFFQNKICGLCSNYDTQKSWEFEGPSQKLYPDARSFAMSYVIPDSSCPASYKSHTYKSPSPSYTLSTYNTIPQGTPQGSPFASIDMCTLEQKTHVRVFKNVVCFSQQPITKCSFECADVEQQEKRKIKYNCFSKSHPLVQTMRDTAEERLLSPSELRGYKAVKTRRVNVDTVCKPE